MNLARKITYEEKENHIIVYTEEVAHTVSSLMEFAENIDKPIDDLVVRKATLEDVFLKLTGREME